MELCNRVQCYAEDCRGTYLCATKHDDAQQIVGVFPPERSPNAGIRHTIGFGTLRFGEKVDHRLTVSFHLSLYNIAH